MNCCLEVYADLSEQTAPLCSSLKSRLYSVNVNAVSP